MPWSTIDTVRTVTSLGLLAGIVVVWARLLTVL